MANCNDDFEVEVTDADLVDSSLDPVSGLYQMPCLDTVLCL